MSGIPRKRASLACRECNRRKLKCDKQSPCARCSAGGIASSCTRTGSGRLRSPGQEAIVPYSSATARTPEASSAQPAVCGRSMNTLPPVGEQDEVDNAATILEFLAWGRRKEVSYATQLSPCEDEHFSLIDEGPDSIGVQHSSSLQYLQLLLPERPKVTQLVGYHIDCLLWYHGSFHGLTFRNQLHDFYERQQGDVSFPGLDLQWVALLFAVLTGSISCGKKSEVLSWGFKEAEQVSLSRRWLHAVTSCLNAAHYMANPSILSCEAITTLTISAHILGYSNQQSVLLASAVRLAQSLGLHRLGETSGHTIELERGRRVWRQLCTQDWFSIPFADCYIINPLYSCSSEPLHCDDQMQALSPSTPTVTSYCRYLHSVAALMPQLQDGLATANTLFTKYEVVMHYDQKMRSLASEQRPHFLCNVPIDPSWPPWVEWARSTAAISSSHKIIMIHRKFLSMSFTNSAFAFTRRTCIAASKTILKEVSRTDGPTLWIFHAFAVAAGITLSLDALHLNPSDPQRQEHCAAVRGAIQLLDKAHNSKIASRGARILSDIMLLIERSSRSQSAKRKADSPIQGNEKRHCSMGMRDIVRDLQNRALHRPHDKNLLSPGTPNVASQRTSATGVAMPTYVDTPSGFGTADTVHDAFLAAEDALRGFHSSYFTQDADAFGSLLNLAQTWSHN